ncbi:Alpha/Beta hydrolase protein [Microdochium bolleyi]|uniref:Alpha/Beta hydrolase protein n=1 Tax=Microdochium bolleyi TaxID=196109 RepID=A0A136IT67_9PEZI|nr:Alpha/Beta hydrolase protein [Microdochium bolleyi]
MAAPASTTPSGVSTKHFTTADGTTYAYEHAPASSATGDDGADRKPTFLFFHGFPSTRHDWAPQITALSAAGLGVIAPDMLGFGDSDKPDPQGDGLSAYRWRRMAGHMDELLGSEGLTSVIGVGHDWGAGALARTYNYHPERFSRLVFMSVGYFPPGGYLDIDAINAGTLAATGTTQYGYWYFLSHFSAPDIIGAHLESFYSTLYTPSNATQASDFGHIGAARARLLANTISPLATWDTEAHRDQWLEYFRRPGAVAAALNPYRRTFAGTDVAEEDAVPDERKPLDVPVTLIGGTQDTVTPGAQMRMFTEPWAKQGVEEFQLDAGHWLGLEKADEVSEILLKVGGCAA